MDKGQKFEFQQQIENYLEDNHVYELFEDLLQQLLVAKPDKPLDYLIEQLDKKKPGKSVPSTLLPKAPRSFP